MKLIHKNTISGLLLAASLGSCVVGKKYARPDLEAPQQFRTPIAVTADTIQLPWRTFFKDPQLVALIDQALKRNNDIGIAVKNVEQLDLAVKQARLGLLPTVNLAAGANRSWLSKNSLNGSLSEQFLGTSYMDDYSAAVQVSWEADIWGKVKMQKEGAMANYFAQRENLTALKTRIISQVAQSYFNLISLDEQLKIARQNIALSRSKKERSWHSGVRRCRDTALRAGPKWCCRTKPARMPIH